MRFKPELQTLISKFYFANMNPLDCFETFWHSVWSWLQHFSTLHLAMMLSFSNVLKARQVILISFTFRRYCPCHNKLLRDFHKYLCHSVDLYQFSVDLSKKTKKPYTVPFLSALLFLNNYWHDDFITSIFDRPEKSYCHAWKESSI